MRNPVSGVGGSLTALITPFRATRIDWEAASNLAERQIERGTAALIVCGLGIVLSAPRRKSR